MIFKGLTEVLVFPDINVQTFQDEHVNILFHFKRYPLETCLNTFITLPVKNLDLYSKQHNIGEKLHDFLIKYLAQICFTYELLKTHVFQK